VRIKALPGKAVEPLFKKPLNKPTTLDEITRFVVANGFVRQSYAYRLGLDRDFPERIRPFAPRYHDGLRLWLREDIETIDGLPIIGLQVALVVPDPWDHELDEDQRLPGLMRNSDKPTIKWGVFTGTVFEYSKETAPGKGDDLFVFRLDDCKNDFVVDMCDRFRNRSSKNGTDRYRMSYDTKDFARAVQWFRDWTWGNPLSNTFHGTQVSGHDSWRCYQHEWKTCDNSENDDERISEYLGKKVASMFPDPSIQWFEWKIYTGKVALVSDSSLWGIVYAIKWDDEIATKLSHTSQKYRHEVWTHRQHCVHYNSYELDVMIAFHAEKENEGAIPVRSRNFSLERLNRIPEYFGNRADGVYTDDDRDYSHLITEMYEERVQGFVSYSSVGNDDHHKMINHCPIFKPHRQLQSVCNFDHKCDKSISTHDMYRNCFGGPCGEDHVYVVRINKLIIVMNKDGFIIDPFTGKVTDVWVEVSPRSNAIIDIRFGDEEIATAVYKRTTGLLRADLSTRSTYWGCTRVCEDKMSIMRSEAKRIARNHFKRKIAPWHHVVVECDLTEGVLVSRYEKGINPHAEDSSSDSDDENQDSNSESDDENQKDSNSASDDENEKESNPESDDENEKDSNSESDDENDDKDSNSESADENENDSSLDAVESKRGESNDSILDVSKSY
jgi:heat shock protein HspQ